MGRLGDQGRWPRGRRSLLAEQNSRNPLGAACRIGFAWLKSSSKARKAGRGSDQTVWCAWQIVTTYHPHVFLMNWMNLLDWHVCRVGYPVRLADGELKAKPGVPDPGCPVVFCAGQRLTHPSSCETSVSLKLERAVGRARHIWPRLTVGG